MTWGSLLKRASHRADRASKVSRFGAALETVVALKHTALMGWVFTGNAREVVVQSKLILILCGLTAGASLACDTAPTMSVGAPTAVVGDKILVSFNSPIKGKASNLHWITLQSVDAPDSLSTGRIVVEHGQTSARVRATESGTLEVRLHDRSPQKDTHLVGRAPVRVLATRGKADVPPVAGAASSEKECLDRWLATQKLDAYGSPEGSVYADISPLFDQSSDRMTPRTAYLYAKASERETCLRVALGASACCGESCPSETDVPASLHGRSTISDRTFPGARRDARRAAARWPNGRQRQEGQFATSLARAS